VQADVPEWHNAGGRFSVVRSAGGQLSVWPVDRRLPAGWQATGPVGAYAECLAAVTAAGQAWTRPEHGPHSRCRHDTVVGFVGDAVRRYGERTAVTDADRTLTYRDLDYEAGRMAASLRRRGITHEDRVAVHLPRGVDVFVALLAILKAGGSYVAVDTRYPDARRDLMIRNSGARMVITTPHLRAGAAAIEATAVTVDELTAGAGELLTGADVFGCQAACVLFTSGSSGTPKAIVLEHRNLSYFALNPALPRLEPEDRVAHVSSLSFDAFTFETWCTLAAGAQIIVLPPMPELIAGDPRRELHRQRITAMLAPTMAVNHIASEDPEAFSGLRILHTGGDVILPAACRDLLASSFRGSFHNLYGPTEGTTACTGHHVTTVDAEEVNVPIGQALAGADVYLLDGDRRPVGHGETGELFIGGAGVARGYLDQPGLTASRFLPDPFAVGGGRMYATGDLARRRDDGLLEFLGRIDDQVKIRGYRVEPREVERILDRVEGIRDVAVVVTGEGDGKQLVALVTGDSPALPTLRLYATESMPEHLVPSAFAVVSEIPANAHGKRDAPRLLELARAELRRRRDAVSPRDEIERYLAGVWEQLLGAEDVGVHDDFFALGGNSLLAFRLRGRIRRDLNATIDVQDVLTTTVLGDLAELLKGRMAAST
jgi:amino acid adenylation domain-containing protein